ncbi:MAG TPA: hypothetical protein VK464_02575 [Symbiobacteriaceae bacterium]|jgi:tetratricopeptide (TPR) repeat protein|nr:hypothetical protein [Symbiobacteriaceae bacterium]
MIEYLKQLVKAEKWGEVQAYAERMAAERAIKTDEMAVVYCAIVQARFVLGDLGGAVAAGEVALQLARSVGDWDSYCISANALGAAHSMLKQYNAAVLYFEDYLNNVHRAAPFPELHSNVWYNLALVYKALGEGPKAIEALKHALEQALLTGDARRVHAMILTLVDASLKAGQMNDVPRLLAKSAFFLRRRSISDVQETALYHLAYRTEYALLTGRLRRARILAAKGLLAAEERYRHLCSFHMLLSRISREYKAGSEALEHALSARACAVACQRPDLEADATAVVNQLLG